MTILYHITPSANADLIEIHGIKPFRQLQENDRARGLTGAWKINESELWRQDVIWLTQDPTYILFNHGSTDWCRENQTKVISVDVDGLEVVLRENSPYYNDKHEPVEYLYSGIIHRDRIVKIEHYATYVGY